MPPFLTTQIRFYSFLMQHQGPLKNPGSEQLSHWRGKHSCWARGGMWCKGDWHRKTFCFLGDVGFSPLGPLLMQELLLSSWLRMDNHCQKCTRTQGFHPLLIQHCFCMYQRKGKSDRGHWLCVFLPHHPCYGEEACAVLPLRFQGIAWNSCVGMTRSPSGQQWAERQQTPMASSSRQGRGR